MKKSTVLLLTFSVVISLTYGQDDPWLASGSPGLSASFDFDDFNKVKEPMIRSLLKAVNNLDIPDLTFSGGYLKDNKVFVNQSAEDLLFEPIEANNSLIFEVKNFTVQVRSNKFSYSVMSGYLDAFISETRFRVAVQFQKKTNKHGRILPQINVTDCQFILRNDKITLKLGGGIILSILDLIVPLIQGIFKDQIQTLVRDTVMNNGPASLNKMIWDSEGYLTLRDLAPDSFPKGDPMGDLTLDYQLDDDIKITAKRIEFGINATVFNKDKGYKVPSTVVGYTSMPMFDPDVPSKFQIFISNYMLESMMTAYFEKNTISYTFIAEEYMDIPAPFVTDTMEGVFPFLTSRYGKKIPTDLAITVYNIWGMYAYEENKTDINNMTGRLNAKMYIEGEVVLKYPDGKKWSAGKVEFQNTNFSTYINQTNQTVLSFWLHSVNVTEMWLNTNYMGRYRSSPFVINTAMGILTEIINEELAEMPEMRPDLKDFTFGLFDIKDPQINYYDGYLGIGMSLDFFKNSSKPVLRDDGSVKYVIDEDPDWVKPPPIDEEEIKKMEESIKLFEEMIRNGEFVKIASVE